MAEADVQMAEADLENAQAEVEQREAALDQARLDLDRTVLRAPIDGVIIKRDVNPGQTVAVTLEAKTLFTIAQDLRRMEVDGKIDEADIGRLKVGQSTLFTVDSYPERSFTGTVLQVRKAPEGKQNVVTYTVIVSADNPDLLLLPGMTATLRIVTRLRRCASDSISTTVQAKSRPARVLRLQGGASRQSGCLKKTDRAPSMLKSAPRMMPAWRSNRAVLEKGSRSSLRRQTPRRDTVFSVCAWDFGSWSH